MNELIKIKTNEDGKQLVSARELYEFLGLKKRFSAWVEQYIKEDNDYMFIKGEDFTSVLSSTVVNNGANRELQDYAITISMAKEISMVTKTEKGKEARQYFINCEKKLKEIGICDGVYDFDKTLMEFLEKEVKAKENTISMYLEDSFIDNVKRIVNDGVSRYSERINWYEEMEIMRKRCNEEMNKILDEE